MARGGGCPLSLMFEAAASQISGAGGVIPGPQLKKGVPDLPTKRFLSPTAIRGHPACFDLLDKHGIKLSSFMIGKAVENLAGSSLRRSYDAVTEAAAHGRVWDNS